MRNLVLILGTAALAACGSNGTNVTCGDGTTLTDDICQPNDGSGSDTTCGTGTHLVGTMCVPDGADASGAPTITMMDPADAGVSGFVLFTITGTNFAGADVSGLQVFFGDTTNPDCEAQVGTATATTIAGEVPPLCSDLNVTVTVSTNKGMATTPFLYDALFAADGDGGGNFGFAGDLYIMDPFTPVYFDIGPITDADENEYGLSGIAFDSTGILYGVTTGDSPADEEVGSSQLVTITLDPDLGPQATVVGATINTGGETTTDYFINDIKMSGTTLYGWAYYTVEDTEMEALVTISTTTGKVTQVGEGMEQDYRGNSALAIDNNGTIVVAPSGAAEDESVGATGEIDSVDSTSGVLTNLATGDWNFGEGAPIEAMTYVGTTLYAVVDDGTYGAGTESAYYGETLAIVDPAGDPVVQSFYQLPAQLSYQSAVDALDLAPPIYSLGKHLKRANWQHLNPVGSTTSTATHAMHQKPLWHHRATR